MNQTSDDADQQPTPLGRLLRTRAEEIARREGLRRLTGDEVAARAGTRPDGELRVAHYTWSRLTKDPVRAWPSRDTIAGLSEALQLPVSIINQAVVESLGIELPSSLSSAAWRLVADIEALADPQARAWVLWLTQTLVDAVKRGNIPQMPAEVDVRFLHRQGELANELFDEIQKLPPDAFAEFEEWMRRLSQQRRRDCDDSV